MQDNLLTYPFVKKEDFENIERENKQLREDKDKLYVELGSTKELVEVFGDINKLIGYSLNKDEKSDEVKEIKKNLKEISSIEKLSKLTSDNIKFKIELNNKLKIIEDLNIKIKELQEEIRRIIETQEAKDSKNKQTIFKIRNIDELMKDKLKENELMELKNNQLKLLNEQLQKELTKKAYKLGYIGEEEQKPLIAYSVKEDKHILRRINKIKKLMNSRFLRDKKQEKAKMLLFDVKQSISLMPEENQKPYKEAISKFDEVLNG